MKERHYDLIVLGDSLASRITAALLAKGGRRVLRFRGEKTTPSPWPHSGLHLEKLLDRLGGKSSLTPSSPFQVLTETARLDLHRSSPFERELAREFPNHSSVIGRGLLRLQSLGEKLERTLLETGIFGPRFLFGRLRHGLPPLHLHRPLRSVFPPFEDGSADEALSALFGGLSLSSYEDLNLAEGALLWSGALRPSGASSCALEKLLEERYRQFHGEEERLSSLEEATLAGRRIEGVTTRKGDRYTADHFLLGDLSAASRLLPEFQPRDRLNPPEPWSHTAEVEGELSPLLCPRVIVGGGPPLRLSFFLREDRTWCTLEGLSPAVEMTDRLRPLLPFASLEPPPEPEGGKIAKRKKARATTGNPLLRAGIPVRLRRNLWLCRGASVLPSLGTTGEVILGMTVAERLLRKTKRK